ncbi:MAG: aspartate aminotransferase family protein [Candidatus Hadarchaeales archaeon]
MRTLEVYARHVANTYNKIPLILTKGKGMYVFDEKGRRYIDFVGGIAVCSLGHCPTSVVKVLRKQLGKLMHASNLYYTHEQANLARLLAQICPNGIEKFFFCNSGAEANEGALKLAIKHTKRSKIIVMEGSFHGRTALTVGATWKIEYRKPYEAIIPKVFEFVPFGDLQAVERAMNDQVAAVLTEPIQGEGGVRVPPDDFLPGLRKLCDERNVLLVLDEIQTGMCRTGKWFACEHWRVSPDVMTMAKALGSGFPIGALGARAEVMDSFMPGDHASTFGGNPLACVAAIETIKTMKKLKLPERVTKTGDYFMKRLLELAESYKQIVEVRGKGLMIGMEVVSKEIAQKIQLDMLKKGFLINVTAEKVLRFVPPLIVEKSHIDKLVDALDQLLGG